MRYVILILLLTGCSGGDDVKEVDVRPTALKDVRVQFFDDFKSLNKRYEELQAMGNKKSIKFERVPYGSRRMGFHAIWKGGTADEYSVIYLVKPSVMPLKKWECVVGHEFNHELFGHYHEPNKLPHKLKIK